MNSKVDPQRLAELKVWGFTVIHDVLDKSTANTMREFVQQHAMHIGVESSHRGSARHLANLVTLDPMCLSVIDHPAVLPYVEQVMGKHLILGSLSAHVVRPNEEAQTLHSDVPIEMHRYGDEAPLMMNTVWSLSDLNSENGALDWSP